MSFFGNAQGVEVNSSQFTATAITINNDPSGPTGIDILREASTPEAAYDSSARAYSARCFPGTRAQYIKDIVNWAIPSPGDNPAPIYWMRGPAGVGKSAIAQTCAEELQERGALGAAFFFSVNRQDKAEKFFPSIAYQLSTIHPAYRDIIDRKVRHDKTIVNKAMRFQFRYLIDEPLQELEESGKGIRRSVQVFVDGLDECEGVEAQCEIIRIVATSTSGGIIPLRWAFFSRPESHIEATFSSPDIDPQCSKVILPISSDADKEIELYLRSGFKNILQRRNTSMESPWPSTEDIRMLVGAADGLFIYAATVLRYVGHPDSLGPQGRLRAIIDIILDRRERNPHVGTSDDPPFAELDGFYTLILRRIPKKILPSVQLLLALLCRPGSLGVMLAANLLRLSKDEFEIVCNHASAVVHLQDSGTDLKLDPTVDTSYPYTQVDQNVLVELRPQVRYRLGGSVSFYHKSFEDFLLDPTRSGSYCVKVPEALGKHCLKVHLDYDRTFSWDGSELVLAPGVPDSASSLSYPYTNEFINSFIKAWVYCALYVEDSESYFVTESGDSLATDRDFRKRLHVLTYLRRVTFSDSSQIHRARIWGCESHCRFFPGVFLAWIPRSGFPEFDVAQLKLMVKRRLQANIIQPYRLNLASRIKSLFRNKTRKGVESALYRMGHGEKSIFWYWEIDHKLQQYREFRATDLAEGEKMFQKESFDSLPEFEETDSEDE